MKCDFSVKCFFEDGNVIYTYFQNQDPEEIANYYVGHEFNFGVETDDMHVCTKVEFIYN